MTVRRGVAWIAGVGASARGASAGGTTAQAARLNTRPVIARRRGEERNIEGRIVRQRVRRHRPAAQSLDFFAQEISMTTIRRHLAALLLGLTVLMPAWAADRVVYHIADAESQALGGLRNVKNQLDTEPATQVIVVAHAQGVDFLMNDAKDRNGNPYAIAVEDLVRRGVKFEVCEITLKNRSLKKEQFIPEATFTPSGVVRITKLQAQGYSYLRP